MRGGGSRRGERSAAPLLFFRLALLRVVVGGKKYECIHVYVGVGVAFWGRRRGAQAREEGKLIQAKVSYVCVF